ncbi:ATP-binding protein [Streptomyces sp. NPDC101776]|uniref:ATP-binding protein n=1 Tax=Streptomyces sp. NPDC101776 TaxID=3366146 RepID=UPI0038055547
MPSKERRFVNGPSPQASRVPGRPVPGLTAARIAHDFGRFYRADTSRTRVTGGAGLGLAIVDSLVTAHAGRVRVRSTPGRGATFSARLPLNSELRAPVGVLG